MRFLWGEGEVSLSFPPQSSSSSSSSPGRPSTPDQNVEVLPRETPSRDGTQDASSSHGTLLEAPSSVASLPQDLLLVQDEVRATDLRLRQLQLPHGHQRRLLRSMRLLFPLSSTTGQGSHLAFVEEMTGL